MHCKCVSFFVKRAVCTTGWPLVPYLFHKSLVWLVIEHVQAETDIDDSNDKVVLLPSLIEFVRKIFEWFENFNDFGFAEIGVDGDLIKLEDVLEYVLLLLYDLISIKVGEISDIGMWKYGGDTVGGNVVAIHQANWLERVRLNNVEIWVIDLELVETTGEGHREVVSVVFIK